MADRDWSTLEPVNIGYQPWQRKEVAPGDLGKQVVVDNNGKEAIKPYHDGLEPSRVPQYSTLPKEYQQPIVDEQQHPKRSRKWLWIGGAILLILVIIGAVLGGVLGSRKSNKSSPSPSPSPSSPPATNSTTPDTPGNDTVVPMTNIAAVAVNSATRVFYQDKAGMLIEAAQSSTSKPWEFTELELLEKKNAPLAAAVTRPDIPLQMSIYYTDINDELHDLVYNPATEKWSQGILFEKNRKTYPNSSLSAMYHHCLKCSNTTILVFQDLNGFAIMAKLQDGKWTTQQLDLGPLVPGTAFAFTPSYEANKPDKILLYHQQENQSIALASYGRVWNAEATIEVYSTGPKGTPIAAVSSYSNNSAGFSDWRHMMKLSENGIQVSTWLGNNTQAYKSDYIYTSFANATETNVKTYGSMAVTANKRAFAVVEQPPGNFSILAYSMSDGYESWAGNGNVTTWY